MTMRIRILSEKADKHLLHSLGLCLCICPFSLNSSCSALPPTTTKTTKAATTTTATTITISRSELLPIHLFAEIFSVETHYAHAYCSFSFLNRRSKYRSYANGITKHTHMHTHARMCMHMQTKLHRVA